MNDETHTMDPGTLADVGGRYLSYLSRPILRAGRLCKPPSQATWSLTRQTKQDDPNKLTPLPPLGSLLGTCSI